MLAEAIDFGNYTVKWGDKCKLVPRGSTDMLLGRISRIWPKARMVEVLLDNGPKITVHYNDVLVKASSTLWKSMYVLYKESR